MQVERDLAEQHYAEHASKPFFGELVDFITGGPLVAMVLEGHEAVPAARQVIGATNPIEAVTGSIRGDFALEVTLTSCTARTRRSRPRARPRSSSPSSGSAATLVLASRSPQRRAILDAAGDRVRGGACRSRRGRGRGPAGAGGRERAAKARAVPGDRSCSASIHRGRSTVALYGKPADEGEARAVLSLPVRADARGLERDRAAAGRRGADRHGRHHGAASASSTHALLDWYLASGEWRERAGGYAIQGRGAALVDVDRGRLLERRRPARPGPARPRAGPCCCELTCTASGESRHWPPEAAVIAAVSRCNSALSAKNPSLH